jgi:hypothetical protein
LIELAFATPGKTLKTIARITAIELAYSRLQFPSDFSLFFRDLYNPWLMISHYSLPEQPESPVAY